MKLCRSGALAANGCYQHALVHCEGAAPTEHPALFHVKNMLKPHLIAMLMIACSALSNWAAAQNVYKCGSSYSQTPCADGQVLQLDDRRTPAQQQQTDAAARSDEKLARQLEQQRLAQEKQATANARQATKEHAVSTIRPATTPAPEDAPLTKITPKKKRVKTVKPWHFIAEVPGSEKQAVAKKARAKKASKTP